jgi:hypothetical protein
MAVSDKVFSITYFLVVRYIVSGPHGKILA